MVDEVFRIYGRYPAYKLSALTHEPDTPWYYIFNNIGANAAIPNDLIQRYFVKFTNARATD